VSKNLSFAIRRGAARADRTQRCGKTTVFNLNHRRLSDRYGPDRLDGVDIARIPSRRRNSSWRRAQLPEHQVDAGI